MKRLQVLLSGKWKYVFCSNCREANPMTTTEKRLALKERDLKFFESKYGNHQFRVI
jgi:RNase P subunit RPR2